MNVISKDFHIYSFASEMQPVATVEPGSQLVFETYDCYRNQLTHPSTHEILRLDGANPATGPVAILGAEPGDILKVDILSIELNDTGTMRIRPGVGVLKNCVEYPEVRKLPVSNGLVSITDDLKIPIRPMIGVIGVAPAKGSIQTLSPGDHGGNMDTKEITTGATLYLPVFQKGALFALGDLHAAMGDGEVAICGVEIGAKVEVRVEVLKGTAISQPILENDEYIYVISSNESVDKASEQATEGMFRFLKERMTHLTDNEIVLLMGATGDVRISQLVNPLRTAKFRMPKAYITYTVAR
ncbi:acetamidase/formamidase family protein [Brevibacillus sp. SYSU BS000544]|uniref:acetamidase/formamidase family protein n=1 Tax=Brevibacillus sp. SYSU BS000544 TaxID=3416443 RepID=UPI003CE4C1C2